MTTEIFGLSLVHGSVDPNRARTTSHQHSWRQTVGIFNEIDERLLIRSDAAAAPIDTQCTFIKISNAASLHDITFLAEDREPPFLEHFTVSDLKNWADQKMRGAVVLTAEAKSKHRQRKPIWRNQD